MARLALLPDLRRVGVDFYVGGDRAQLALSLGQCAPAEARFKVRSHAAVAVYIGKRRMRPNFGLRVWSL